MDSKISSQLTSLRLLLTLESLLLHASANPRQFYDACGSTTFSCGSTIARVGYPFRGSHEPPFCGHPSLVLTCDDATNSTTIDVANTAYRVLGINSTEQTMRIVREDVMEVGCPREIANATFDRLIFEHHGKYANLSFFYGCPDPIPPGLTPGPCGDYTALPGHQPPANCSSVVMVPVEGNVRVNITGWDRVLRQGFTVKWKVDRRACDDCMESGGRCGFNFGDNRATCFCMGPPYVSDTCHDTSPQGNDNNSNSGMRVTGRNRNSNSGMRIGLPIGGAVLAGIGVGWLILYRRQRRKNRVERLGSRSSGATSKDIATSPSSKPLYCSKSALSFTTASNSDLGGGNTYYGVQVFDYAELEEATDNFDPSRVLGQGGFASVYHGTLSDGRVVAVKRLYENNFKRAEQFMNEVEILARLRHKNLVSLYGCTSRRSSQLLLVYEFIPNGTVADHLHGRLHRAGPALLPWPVRLNIAVETAEALNYLHDSDIVHRDIKTNNILLDSAFHVKVADFGLSRLFPTDATHVSTVPQGTPGYVDPEYYQCYQLTEKSDVYSFGVVLVELLSSLMAVDTNRQRQDINLAAMAVNRIQNQALDELVDPGLGFRTDAGVRRAATLVAELVFGCLQRESKMRPSMGEVLAGLRRIRDEGMGSGLDAEIMDLQAGDDVGPPRDGVEPPSPDSGSGKNSSG